MLDYRPRSPSELVDVAFGILRRDYARFCLTMAVLTVPWLVLQLVTVRTTNLDLTGQVTPELLPFVGLMAAWVLWSALADGAMVRAASDAYETGTFDPAVALRWGAARYFPVLGARVLKYLAVVAFFMAGTLGIMLVVGMGVGIAMASSGTARPDATWIVVLTVLAMLAGAAVAALPFARYAAVPATAVLERGGGIAAMRRSRDLVRGHARAALGVMVLVWAVYFVVAMGASWVAGAIGPKILEQIASTVVMVFAYPLVVTVNTALYYDLRIRKEGYDLELLARRLDPAAPDAGPGAPAPSPLP